MTQHVRAPRQPQRLSGDDAPRFRWEKFAAIAREIIPLWHRHWAEIALDKERISLDPDFEQYYRLDTEGILRVLTVRVGGELVGYSFSLIGPHLHYRSTRTAHTEMFWLAPEYRSGWTGVRLLRLTRKGLKQLGVKLHTINIKLSFAGGRVAKLLGRLGYKPADLTMRQVL